MIKKINYFLFESKLFYVVCMSIIAGYMYTVNETLSSLWELVKLGWSGPMTFWFDVAIHSVIAFVFLYTLLLLIKVVAVAVKAFHNVVSPLP